MISGVIGVSLPIMIITYNLLTRSSHLSTSCTAQSCKGAIACIMFKRPACLQLRVQQTMRSPGKGTITTRILWGPFLGDFGARPVWESAPK